jgi:hypothetical protein
LSAGGSTPLPIRVGTSPEAALERTDPYVLRSALVRDHVLSLEVSYTGGCRPHAFQLGSTGWSPTEHGVEVDLVLAHDAGGDDCKALVREHLTFDLDPLAAACSDELAEARGLVVLRLAGRRVAARLDL